MHPMSGTVQLIVFPICSLYISILNEWAGDTAGKGPFSERTPLSQSPLVNASYKVAYPILDSSQRRLEALFIQNTLALRIYGNVSHACVSGNGNDELELGQLVHSADTNTESLVMHFTLNNFEDLFILVKQISKYPQSMIKLHKWVFSIKMESVENYMADSPDFRLLGARLEMELLGSNFLQDNPIYFGLESVDRALSPICLVGYKLDLIDPRVVIKSVSMGAEGESRARHGAGTGAHSCMQIFDLHLSSTTYDFDGSTLHAIGVNDSESSHNTNFLHGQPDATMSNNDHDHDHDGDGEDPLLGDCFAREMKRAMELVLNVRIRISATQDWGEYVYVYSNETGTGRWGWNGAVAELQNSTVDFCITALYLAPDRAKAIDFTTAVHIITINAFMRKMNGSAAASASSLAASPLLAPFEPNLWIFVIFACGSIATVSIVLRYLIGKYSEYQAEENDGDSDSVVSQEGPPPGPFLTKLELFKFSLRVQILCHGVVIFLLNAAYAGTLVSHLSITRNPIQTVHDVVASTRSRASGYHIEIDPYILIDRFVRASPEPGIQELYRRAMAEKRDPNPLTTNKMLVEEVTRGNFIYVTEQLSFYRDLNELDPLQACEVQQIKFAQRSNHQTWAAPAVKTGSGIKSAINFSILKMRETGNVGLWKRRHYPRMPSCDSGSKFNKASVWDIQLAFQMLAAAMVAALGVLAVEFVVGGGHAHRTKCCRRGKYRLTNAR